jgi:hypothetical protein
MAEKYDKTQRQIIDALHDLAQRSAEAHKAALTPYGMLLGHWDTVANLNATFAAIYSLTSRWSYVNTADLPERPLDLPRRNRFRLALDVLLGPHSC